MPLTDTSSLLNEALAGRYIIEREIGRGGMSCVYLAHDVRHGRAVALKVLHPELGAAIGADRFLREIQVVARLQHPHIVPLYDSGEASGRLYYVMPYVKGESMRERLKRDGPIKTAEAQRIIREVADALDYAHSEGIVHRDIKPDNIILDDRHAMVTDFGIARALSESGATLTQAGVVIGTPAYMSPEQITGESSIDGRSDIYSLGCVLFEMLSGRAPFTADSVQAMMVMRFAKATPSLEPVEGNANDTLKAVIAKAMQLSPANRFQTAREIMIALDSQENSQPIRSAASAGFKVPAIPLLAGAAVLLLAIGLFAWKSRSGTAAAPSDVQVASIGVLPFVNRSGDKQMDYFSDGLTDELISALSHVAGLQVAGRASSFSMKGKGLDTQDAARRLHVAYIVDAGVRSSGSRVRVTWQLVDARTDRALGSGDIDGEIRDAISLQDSMAKTIVDGLRPVIGPRNTGTMKKHQTANPEAHDLYLKGHFYWNQRTTASMGQGIKLLQQAIEKDSAYALAWAELASAYTLEEIFGDMTPSEAAGPARLAAQKAVELDSALAEAYTARGMSETFNDWNPTAALVDLDKAIRLDPQNSFPRLFRVWPLVMLGRMDEALAELQRAKALDRLSPIINTRLGTILVYKHRYDEAITELREALDLDPTNILARFELGRALSLGGRSSEAFQEFPDALDLETGHGMALEAIAYGRAGDHARARNILTRLQARSKDRYISAVSLCIAAIGAGDKPLALDYLDQALNEHSFFLVFLSSDPSFDAIRDEPRFKRAKEKVERRYASSL
jgi:serine/threonine-protein kinase